MELLKKLYLIDAKSGKEKAQRNFIEEYVKKIAGVSCKADKHGNLLVVKGKSDTYPCVVAHMDEVHDKRDKDFVVLESNGFLQGMNVGKRERHGIGADDKNGIWVALRCIEKYDAIKCVFFVEEETGCRGSYAVDMKFFDDCRFVLECDRRDKGDFIVSIGGQLCSNEFINDAKIKDFGYKKENGMSTDVGTLKSRGLEVSCCNMSCGYYEPHTKYEYTYFPDLERCMSLVAHIIDNCTKVYTHKRQIPASRPWSGGFNAFDDDYYGGGRITFGSSYKERQRQRVEQYINLEGYDNLIDAWVDARMAIPGLQFEEFTDIWVDVQHELMEEEYLELEKAEKKHQNAV